MKSSFFRFSLTALVSCFSSVSFASDLDALYQKLRHVNANYQVFGTVCEEVARVRLREQYSSKDFDIKVGIVYQEGGNRQGGRTLGELDVVVFRKADKEAILVGEVKCWRHLSKAIAKAEDQMDRFQGHIRRGTRIHMFLDSDRHQVFSRGQFDESPEFIAISQNGGESAGFAMTIGIELDEAYRLQEMLLQCQSDRDCMLPPLAED